MQKNLHPAWNHAAQVTCACGNTFTTGSKQDTLQVDICSKCHPFFTGEMRFVDRQGRVDKFRQRMEAAQASQANLQAKRAKKAGKTGDDQAQPKSYKQLLQDQKKTLKEPKAA